MPINLVTRSEWKAQEEPYKAKPLPSPVNSIQLFYSTECDECIDKEDCIETVQALQKLHKEEDGLMDINYNFLIGGDKNVYECRGWDKAVEMHPSWNTQFKDRLAIGLIGHHIHGPPQQLLVIVEEFVKQYTAEGKLSKEYVAINV